MRNRHRPGSRIRRPLGRWVLLDNGFEPEHENAQAATGVPLRWARIEGGNTGRKPIAADVPISDRIQNQQPWESKKEERKTTPSLDCPHRRANPLGEPLFIEIQSLHKRWMRSNACLRGTRLLPRAAGRICAGREPRATRANAVDTPSQMRPRNGWPAPPQAGRVGSTRRTRPNPGGLGQAALPSGRKRYGSLSKARMVPNQLDRLLVITMPGTPQPRFEITSVSAWLVMSVQYSSW